VQDRTNALRGRRVRNCELLRTSPERKAHAAPLSGQIDAFAVYCRETGGVYLIPIEDLPLDRAYLRVREPRNAQRKRVRFARDFEIATVTWAASERVARC
jgi:hypothetical protein